VAVVEHCLPSFWTQLEFPVADRSF
jgi:hypothetical protein